MSAKWQKVSAERAKLHPLYGVRGWLMVLAIGMPFGFVIELARANQFASTGNLWGLFDFLSTDDPKAKWLSHILMYDLIAVIGFYWTLLGKYTQFRELNIFFLIARFPVYFMITALNRFPGGGVLVVESLFLGLPASLVWGAYYLKSKRVRVTFENSIHSSDVSSVSVKGESLRDQGPSSSATAISTANIDVRTLVGVSRPSAVLGLPGQTIPSDRSWERALAEFDGPSRRAGLWARVFALSDGDEARAKANYLRTRAVELHNEQGGRSDVASDHHEATYAENHSPVRSKWKDQATPLPVSETSGSESVRSRIESFVASISEKQSVSLNDYERLYKEIGASYRFLNPGRRDQAVKIKFGAKAIIVATHAEGLKWLHGEFVTGVIDPSVREFEDRDIV